MELSNVRTIKADPATPVGVVNIIVWFDKVLDKVPSFTLDKVSEKEVTDAALEIKGNKLKDETTKEKTTTTLVNNFSLLVGTLFLIIYGYILLYL